MQIEYLERINQELRLRNYSFKTIKAYLSCLGEYYDFAKVDIEKIDEDKIKQFLLAKQSKNYSSQTINLYLNAIKFFYREVSKTPQKINLKFAKRSKKLPIVLSRQEIKEIIDSIKNQKHKLIISLTYGAGLRISEVVNLKVKDIDFNELIIHLKNAKGKKDRITIFPEKIKNDLQNLIAGKNSFPPDPLFFFTRLLETRERFFGRRRGLKRVVGRGYFSFKNNLYPSKFSDLLYSNLSKI